MRYKLHTGDCVEYMKQMSDCSVNLIATDPPYYRVKNEPWDKQWDTERGFLDWMRRIVEQFQRILKPNGSLYLFASPKMAFGVEGVVREYFNVLNQITWTKPNDPGYEGWHKKCSKESLRQFYPVSERVIFAESRQSFSEMIRAKRLDAGMTMIELTGACGAHGDVNHGGAVSNWENGRNTPTEIQWERMSAVLDIPQYKDAVRVFNASAEVQYADVWSFPTVKSYKGKHPCEKPISMMEHIVSVSSRPGDIVFDPFMGSGATGVASINIGREFVGCDLSKHWVDYTEDRLMNLLQSPNHRQRRSTPKKPSQSLTDLPLFSQS